MILSLVTENKDGVYDTCVDVKGNDYKVVIELKSIFESFITSEHPELIYAIVYYYLPKFTEQIAEGSISENKLSYYLELLKDTKGGEY